MKYRAMEQKILEKKKSLDFSTKGPVPLFLEEEKPDQRPGCNIIDFSFIDPVTISEIQFRNYYTASVSVSCRKVPLEKDVRNRDTLPWQSSVKQLLLMPDPHCEQGSQDYFAIPSSSSAVPWSGIVSIRFVLKQPSAYWRRFGIEEISFCKENLAVQKPITYVPRMFSSKTNTSPPQEGVNKEETGNHFQKLKQIVEMMKSVHTGATVGRFEIDGSYDITHLV